MTRVEKLAHANAILSAFVPGVTLEFDRGYWFGWYEPWRKARVRKRWAAPRNSDYPLWFAERPCGGTGCVGMASLVRWLRGGRLHRPWWVYATSETGAGLDPATLAAVDAAIAAEGCAP